eukprot:3850883-Rhodomonas_salina.2
MLKHHHHRPSETNGQKHHLTKINNNLGRKVSSAVYARICRELTSLLVVPATLFEDMGDDVLACSFVPGEQMAKALSEKRELEKQLEQTKQQ